MKTITKTYLQGCSYCFAKGMIPSYDGFGHGTTLMFKTCPVCKGEKTVLITETITDDIGSFKGRPNPQDVNCYDSKARKRVKNNKEK